MDLAAGVAVRVAALCLDADGRPSERRLIATAVRGGLLLDLALAGRVESTDDSIVVDDTPTGFFPADRLLAAIVVEPERSLDGWLDERRIGFRDVADAAVHAGRWEVTRRPFRPGRCYRDLAPEQTARDADPNLTAPDDVSPVDAAVAAVALAAELIRPPRPVPESLLARTASARWLVEAVVEHLVDAAARDEWSAAVLRAGTTGPF
jgi:hypothetical protein